MCLVYSSRGRLCHEEYIVFSLSDVAHDLMALVVAGARGKDIHVLQPTQNVKGNFLFILSPKASALLYMKPPSWVIWFWYNSLSMVFFFFFFFLLGVEIVFCCWHRLAFFYSFLILLL
jgi:hypothetical protein